MSLLKDQLNVLNNEIEKLGAHILDLYAERKQYGEEDQAKAKFTAECIIKLEEKESRLMLDRKELQDKVQPGGGAPPQG